MYRRYSKTEKTELVAKYQSLITSGTHPDEAAKQLGASVVSLKNWSRGGTPAHRARKMNRTPRFVSIPVERPTIEASLIRILKADLRTMMENLTELEKAVNQ